MIQYLKSAGPHAMTREELILSIWRASEKLQDYDVTANTVVLNRKKYGAFIKPGGGTYLFGMAVELYDLQDEVDFLVQCREQEPRQTNYDLLHGMSMERLAKVFFHAAGCREWPSREAAIAHCQKTIHCDECWLEWLREEVQP